MGQQVEEATLVERIAAACQGYFREPPEQRDAARLRQFCVELVRRDRCVVYTYATDEAHFWLQLRREGLRGWSHYLAEVPVLDGKWLEVWHDGRWVRARYHARGLGEGVVIPECVLALETHPPVLLYLDQADEVICARWPRGPLL